ncbi:MAG: hypothetical protein GY859_07455, partial [Desulfobacterales bacterium]|nr:hypothetical protein [Desulfobacterales bacterium]
DLFAGQPVDIPAMISRLRETAADLGLPFGSRGKSYNSRLAQELGKWAESRGRGDAFHDAVFRAYFVDNVNIAETPVLLAISTRVGLSSEEAREVLENRSFRKEVDLDWTRCHEKGIRAAPTFIMNDNRLVGARPHDILERFILDGKRGKSLMV